MLKCSHKFVAKRIADRYHLPFAYKTALIFGGVFPDCRPSCFLKPHTRENWAEEIDNMVQQLKANKKYNIRYFLKAGTVLHMYADFFTYPHSDINVHYFKSGHAKWEKQLHKKLKNNFKFTDVSLMEAGKIDFKDIFNIYDIDVHSIESDCSYISLAVSIICQRLGMEQPGKERLSERTARIIKQYTTEELVKISIASAKPEN